jgi:hypothetical protein
MKKCNTSGCGSYAVNIEQDETYDTCLCDVCHWRVKHENLQQANEIANNTIALMAKQVTKLTDERDKAIQEIGIWSRKAGKLEAEIDLLYDDGIKKGLKIERLEAEVTLWKGAAGDEAEGLESWKKESERLAAENAELTKLIQEWKKDVLNRITENAKLRGLVDGAMEIVEIYKPEDRTGHCREYTACETWKRDWLKKANDALKGEKG